jgi:hypothetical protein
MFVRRSSKFDKLTAGRFDGFGKLTVGKLTAGRLAMSCLLLLLVMLSTSGCVEQLLTIDSDPSGAVVALNDQEIGRTPLTTNFKWYGFYEATVRKDGYQTLKTTSPVIAPVWQFVPFDLVAEVIPIRYTDHHYLHYSLQPMTAELNDPGRLLLQGEQLRGELESGANEPRVRPVKAPTTKPAIMSRPATEPSRESITGP